ncbi:MAG: di-trans,poly-cis-decaprenylcistransferase [Omnitrophica WOR_2 bacterium GWA2_47_8]|nr:MAG: di-trans,poly-cis-decaprenylcistransferase [Omnitrophica WOR_2 bacterium GWA2_47_8]
MINKTTPTITDKLPKHVAIILDGNGRWARMRNLSRSQGHIEGVKRVEEIVHTACDLGIKVLTLYTFSTENWKRPQNEVSTLMQIICKALNKKVDDLMRRNIRFQLIGKQDGAPADMEVFNCIQTTINQTKGNTGMVLNMAFNYGARTEIVDAVRGIAKAVSKKEISPDDINEEVFSNALYTKGLPDPDLLIRTSGEQRISNFLLWQLSYAEFYFTEKFWPDFDKEEFYKAIREYQKRERRYGEVVVNS